MNEWLGFSPGGNYTLTEICDQIPIYLVSQR